MKNDIMAEGGIVCQFSDLSYPSNLVAIDSGFCFADRSGIYRYDIQHKCLFKVVNVPEDFFPKRGGLIHLYKSFLYVYDSGLLFILDVKKNIWSQFKNDDMCVVPRINPSTSRWIEIDTNLCLYDTVSHAIQKDIHVWCWDDKNNSKCFLEIFKMNLFIIIILLVFLRNFDLRFGVWDPCIQVVFYTF